MMQTDKSIFISITLHTSVFLWFQFVIYIVLIVSRMTGHNDVSRVNEGVFLDTAKVKAALKKGKK